MANNFTLKNAKALSETYNDALPTSFKDIISGCTNGDFFSPEKPMNKLSSWKDYCYPGDVSIIDVRLAGQGGADPGTIYLYPGGGESNGSIYGLGYKKMQGGNVISNSYLPATNVKPSVAVKSWGSGVNWLSLTTEKITNSNNYKIIATPLINNSISSRQADCVINADNASYPFNVFQAGKDASNMELFVRYRLNPSSNYSSYYNSIYAVAFKATGNGDAIVDNSNSFTYEIPISRGYDYTLEASNNIKIHSFNSISDQIFYYDPSAGVFTFNSTMQIGLFACYGTSDNSASNCVRSYDVQILMAPTNISDQTGLLMNYDPSSLISNYNFIGLGGQNNVDIDTNIQLSLGNVTSINALSYWRQYTSSKYKTTVTANNIKPGKFILIDILLKSS